MMEITELYHFEFTGDTRILQMAPKDSIYIRTERHLKEIMGAFAKYLDRYLASGRIYIIIDMNHLIIEPQLSRLYGLLAGQIADTYVFPGGIARHGHRITRITVRRGYMDQLGRDPNLFGTRAEAEAYIRCLIARRQTERSEPVCPSPPETA